MKSLLLRRRMAILPPGLLPAGYTQVEYIENTSNAYINTGVKASNNTHLTFTATDKETSNVHYLLGCSGLYSLTGAKYIGLRYVVGSKYVHFGETNHNMGSFSISPQFTLNIYGNVFEIVVNGTPHTYTFEDVDFTTVGNIVYLASSQNGFISNNSKGIIYAGTIDNVRNFIPCINPNNIVGLYDTIGRQFYSSPNGTAFVAGPSV